MSFKHTKQNIDTGLNYPFYVVVNEEAQGEYNFSMSLSLYNDKQSTPTIINLVKPKNSTVMHFFLARTSIVGAKV
jgi:hypothetical protein